MQIGRLTSGFAIVAALSASGSVAFAQDYRGTYEQQMACTPDVFRLCGQHIPDSTRITGCLRENVPRLSGPCRAVFDSNANVASRNADRRGQDAGRAQPRDYQRQGPPAYERQGPPPYEQRRAPAPYGQPYYDDDY